MLKKYVIAIAFIVLGVGLCAYQATRPVEGKTIVCSSEVTKQTSEIVQSMLDSQRKGGWKATQAYWESFPNRKRLHYYRRLFYGSRRGRFSASDSLEVPGKETTIVLNGKLGNGLEVKISLVKVDQGYKIKDIQKKN